MVPLGKGMAQMPVTVIRQAKVERLQPTQAV
jgi:hypothetical protein